MTQDKVHIIPDQAQLPFAIIDGEPLTDVPEDLYVPPAALRVFLEAFEGPLDLLLYLIRRQSLDIMALPITKIAEQYMQYIEMMQELQLDLIGEYLLMAAMLAEIKSRLLLPRPPQEKEEEDPRAELIRRLLEYQRFKKAAEDVDMLPRVERDFSAVGIDASAVEVSRPEPAVDLKDILISFQEVLRRMELRRSHRVQKEPLSMRERMTIILNLLSNAGLVPFRNCFTAAEGKSGAVITLLSILEMLRSGLIEVIQDKSYDQIYIRSRS